jgi:hypothetical protein
MVLWHTDPFLGNNHGTNKARAIAGQQILDKQQLSYSNGGTVGNGVLYLVHAKRLYNENTGRATMSCKSVCEQRTRRLV